MATTFSFSSKGLDTIVNDDDGLKVTNVDSEHVNVASAQGVEATYAAPAVESVEVKPELQNTNVPSL